MSRNTRKSDDDRPRRAVAGVILQGPRGGRFGLPVAFEWRNYGTADARFHRGAAADVFTEAERRHNRAPERVQWANGEWSWIMRGLYDHKTGKLVRLECGCSSPFIVAERRI